MAAERFDDGRLAPVTYLPGVRPARQLDCSGEDLAVDPAAMPPSPSSRSAARHVSVTALSRRGLSLRELQRHLESRGFTPDEVAAELVELERDGYVDDVALAQHLVGILQERKGLGRSAIAAELTRRLLSPAAIEYALDLIDSGDELSRAREIARKRARQLRDLDHVTASRRLGAYLARRGYGGSTVRAAVEHALRREQVTGVVFR